VGSTNGTYLDGVRVKGCVSLLPRSVIRAGQSVLVFLGDARKAFEPLPSERFGIEGPYHAAACIQQLKEAAATGRHVLLAGQSGTGKELAARALARMYDRKLEYHNCARFTSEEEATVTLFGVGAKVFSAVDARMGLLERCQGKALFLDEIHNLPFRVQRSLLRIVENSVLERIGENRSQIVDVRLILASNSSEPAFGLASDLLSRLHVANLPPLSERIADVPELLCGFLRSYATSRGLNEGPLLAALKGDHYEALCLARFHQGNVRQLQDLASRIVAKAVLGQTPHEAVTAVFGEAFSDSPVLGRTAPPSLRGSHHPKDAFFAPATRGSPSDTTPFENEPWNGATKPGSMKYENHKIAIVAAYKASQTLAGARRTLEKSGISCSERWLGHYLERWGIKR
jgi:DNA-binding NtrC family response regulator